ncbi:MAG TPA: nucleotidyltransferase family protein, partial [Sphingobium sp.]|nr:nucleotidyltransferase family protein [Sphingobium sp.]
MSARLLVNVLRRPETVTAFGSTDWNGLVAAARAERLLATLAHRLERADVPRGVRAVMADAVIDAQREQRMALWEADRAREALHPLGVPVILLKGAAYVAAGLKAGEGRMIGDLDILVPRDSLEEAEAL